MKVLLMPSLQGNVSKVTPRQREPFSKVKTMENLGPEIKSEGNRSVCVWPKTCVKEPWSCDNSMLVLCSHLLPSITTPHFPPK